MDKTPTSKTINNIKHGQKTWMKEEKWQAQQPKSGENINNDEDNSLNKSYANNEHKNKLYQNSFQNGSHFEN